jgi:hypothetical protein
VSIGEAHTRHSAEVAGSDFAFQELRSRPRAHEKAHLKNHAGALDSILHARRFFATDSERLFNEHVFASLGRAFDQLQVSIGFRTNHNRRDLVIVENSIEIGRELGLQFFGTLFAARLFVIVHVLHFDGITLVEAIDKTWRMDMCHAQKSCRQH